MASFCRLATLGRRFVVPLAGPILAANLDFRPSEANPENVSLTSRKIEDVYDLLDNRPIGMGYVNSVGPHFFVPPEVFFLRTTSLNIQRRGFVTGALEWSALGDTVKRARLWPSSPSPNERRRSRACRGTSPTKKAKSPKKPER